MFADYSVYLFVHHNLKNQTALLLAVTNSRNNVVFAKQSTDFQQAIEYSECIATFYYLVSI